MQRVMIVGGSGSGKSTLARALGARTGLPVYHMDHVQWKAGWVSRSVEERELLARDIESRARWIFEGGFSATYRNRIARCDTLIWLDFPVGLRLWRVTRRLVRYWGRERPDMTPGCREGFHRETLPFYKWIWDTRKTSREGVLRLIATPPAHVRVVHLTSAAQVAAFLETVPPCP
ncbi:AAA family ATPase [Seohaeicola nanhaiensis]|uniref:AAA family ATPase n=1 Tax=Seohaeicola nanhaiensis TaxID=1387282 RepID=A0ABV9KNG2_9RHOB